MYRTEQDFLVPYAVDETCGTRRSLRCASKARVGRTKNLSERALVVETLSSVMSVRSRGTTFKPA